MKFALALFAFLLVTTPAAAQNAEIAEMRAEVARLQAEINGLKGLIAEMLEEEATPQQPSAEMRALQEQYMRDLTQEAVLHELGGFTVNGDGTATLWGRGHLHLDSDESHVSPGGGVPVRIILTDLDDPLFKKCRAILQTAQPSYETGLLEVEGRGSYEQGKASTDPDSTAYGYVFRLGKLTSCKIRTR